MSADSLLRLLQLTDSSFPVGGYAYSHGLEWLVHEGKVRDADGLGEMLPNFVSQVVQGQWLPAAAQGFRARTAPGAVRADLLLDASIAAEAERAAGRAMGARLLQLAARAGEDHALAEYAAGVRHGSAPGQYAVAFALAARASGSNEDEMLSALGYAMVNSVTQAAIRLGVIGADSAACLVGHSFEQLERAVGDIISTRRPRIGAFAPGLELASMLQPTLRFRMFAS